jgi:hypothetical protein
MALRMVALNRSPDGRWFARKVIPEDVRDEYAKLYRFRREVHLKLPADLPPHEAKARCGEWIGEVETQIATLRARRNGEGQPLTRLSAVALAGRWYNWFVKQHEDNPGSPRHWRDLGDILIWDVIRPHAPEEYEENQSVDESWEWAKAPEVREAVRPLIAEEARVATFLASEGIALNVEALRRCSQRQSVPCYFAFGTAGARRLLARQDPRELPPIHQRPIASCQRQLLGIV